MKKISNLIFLIILASSIVVFCFIFLFCESTEFSQNENRNLTTEVSFSINSILNGEFQNSLELYLNDQFPERSKVITVASVIEARILLQSGDVMKGRDGYLIVREDDDFENLKLYLRYFDNVNLPKKIVIVGRGEDVLTSKLPIFYPKDRAQIRTGILQVIMGSREYIDLSEHLSLYQNWEIYYRTDHHWTVFGAYLAYRRILLEYNLTPYEMEDFEIEHINEAFFGTTWSKYGDFTLPGEDFELWHYKKFDEKEMNITVYSSLDTGVKADFDGFYDRNFLNKKDKYSTFLSGNHGIVHVSIDSALPTLLIVKDSFANTMIPFLALHFNIVMVDPRYYTTDINLVAEHFSTDFALLLVGRG